MTTSLANAAWVWAYSVQQFFIICSCSVSSWSNATFSSRWMCSAKVFCLTLHSSSNFSSRGCTHPHVVESWLSISLSMVVASSSYNRITFMMSCFWVSGGGGAFDSLSSFVTSILVWSLMETRGSFDSSCRYSNIAMNSCLCAATVSGTVFIAVSSLSRSLPAAVSLASIILRSGSVRTLESCSWDLVQWTRAVVHKIPWHCSSLA